LGRVYVNRGDDYVAVVEGGFDEGDVALMEEALRVGGRIGGCQGRSMM
jgi:hypothetical protein